MSSSQFEGHNQMATPKSFFMFCLDDFATKLCIPAVIVEGHGLHHRRQLSLHLKTETAGRSWAVKIKKIDGIFYIADGWPKFVKDNNILPMNVLVFHIVGDSTLHVSIFGHHSCLELPPSARTCGLVKKLKKYNFTYQRLDIPQSFAAEIGKKGEIELEDWQGRKWGITITDRNERMYAFSGGWKAFLTANKLRPGAILLFKFASDCEDVIKVELVEDEAGEEMLTRAKSGGFIPS